MVRVIAGDVAGHVGPGSTHTPIALAHATVSPGAALHLPWRPDFNALVYVLSGRGTVASSRHPVRCGHLVVLGHGDYLRLDAASSQSMAQPQLEVLILGGLPIREPIVMAGPFVMNTRAEVLQAFADFRAGRLGEIPSVHGAPTNLSDS